MSAMGASGVGAEHIRSFQKGFGSEYLAQKVKVLTSAEPAKKIDKRIGLMG